MRKQRAFKTHDKPDEVRRSNMNAAKAVSDAVRTSLGPKGMDKMVSTQRGAGECLCPVVNDRSWKKQCVAHQWAC